MKFCSEDMLHKKDSEVEYLKFKILEEYQDKINHVITLRHGGVNTGDVASLNFRVLNEESKAYTLKNLEVICQKIGISKENVYKASQNHTDHILVLNHKKKACYQFDQFCQKEYDGYLTNQKNIATLVTTADCNPILIYDPRKNVLANLHSGWRGTVKQIYLKAIQRMIVEFDCKPEDLLFCIGPSIRKCCFTSKEREFKNHFTEVWKEEKWYLFYEEDGKTFHIDLPFVIKEDVKKMGVLEKNIAICPICTMCHSDDFYSYRKALQEKKDYGTFATIAYLK